jgi:hypothetical protein
MTRMVLTTTRIYETIYLAPVVDLRSIQSPYNGILPLREALNLYNELVSDSNVRKRLGSAELISSGNFVNRSKRGPNGPSIAASHLDAVAISADQRLQSSLRK